MSIQGHCDPAFTAVRDVFERNFTAGRELGAAVAVYAGDRRVVDLWGGVADHRTGREWAADTPCFAFSCTKAVTATAALLLAERGAYDVTAPVATWWPEFAAAGKEAATAEHLLSHQGGLPAFDRTVGPEEAADPAAMAEQLAGQRPEWPPGEAHGYHALTFGWLAGEIVRRHAGRPVGEFVRREFGAGRDLWIGAPDEVIARAARLSAGNRTRPAGAASENTPAASGDTPATTSMDLLARLAGAYADPGSLLNRTINNPLPGKGGYNNPVVLRAGWPAAGMTTTAEGLAGFYRDLVAGRILRPGTLDEALRPRVDGPDRVMLIDTSFGLGYMRRSFSFPAPEVAAGAFGHTGAGGSIGLGDVAAGIGMAYLPNLMGARETGDLRAYRLVKAVYESLG